VSDLPPKIPTVLRFALVFHRSTDKRALLMLIWRPDNIRMISAVEPRRTASHSRIINEVTRLRRRTRTLSSKLPTPTPVSCPPSSAL
jgi:hypothetical protein